MKSIRYPSIKKQKLLILLCFFAYSMSYVGRYSYNANIGPIIDYYQTTRANAGVVSTFFFFSYGAGQLIHAILCKFYSRKYIVSAALLLSAVINLVLFFLPPFALIKYLWLLNGICQSVLWPTLMMIIGENLESSLMKPAILVMSMTVAVGTLLSYGGSALFNLGVGFRFSFLLGTAAMAGIGVIWLLAFGSVTSEGSEQIPLKNEQNEQKDKTISQTGMRGALIGLLAVCAVFAVVDNFIKDGLNTWSPLILSEQFGFADSISIVLTLVLPIFGIFGSVLALQANRFLKDFRALIGFFYLILSGCLFALSWSMRENTVILTLILFGVISCITNGINSVITSIMPLALRERMNSGLLAGLMNAACYIGSTVSAYGIGKIADGTGWDGVIRILLAVCLLATILAAVVALIRLMRKRAGAGS